MCHVLVNNVGIAKHHVAVGKGPLIYFGVVKRAAFY